jgi:hypothetical protein
VDPRRAERGDPALDGGDLVTATMPGPAGEAGPADEPGAAGEAGQPPAIAGLMSELGGAELPADSGGTARVLVVPQDRLEAAAHRLAAGGARLADLFADGTSPVTVRLVWALDAERRYLITQTAVTGETYPALSDVAPAAFYEECEIYEQFGVRPATGKPLNRVALPPHAGPDFPRLGSRPGTSQRSCTRRTRSAVTSAPSLAGVPIRCSL